MSFLAADDEALSRFAGRLAGQLGSLVAAIEKSMPDLGSSLPASPPPAATAHSCSSLPGGGAAGASALASQPCT